MKPYAGCLCCLRRDTGVRHRTDGRALRRVGMALALRTLFGIDNVNVALEADCRVGTLELTCTTNGALRSDDLVSHAFRLLRRAMPLAIPSNAVPNTDRRNGGQFAQLCCPGAETMLHLLQQQAASIQAMRALGSTPRACRDSTAARFRRFVRHGSAGYATLDDPKPAARLKAASRRTSRPGFGKPPVTRPDWRFCPSLARREMKSRREERHWPCRLTDNCSQPHAWRRVSMAVWASAATLCLTVLSHSHAPSLEEVEEC